jgi:hypothetical protein
MSKDRKKSIDAMRALAVRLQKKVEEDAPESGRLAKIRALISRFLHKTDKNPVQVINDYGGYYKYGMLDPGFRTKQRKDHLDKMRVAWLQGVGAAPQKPKRGKSGS